MQGDDFIGHRPSNVFWATDQSAIYFDWNPDMVFSDSLYRYALNTKEIKKVTFMEGQQLPTTRMIDHPTLKKSVYTKNGDVFILDRSTHTTMAITQTQERESAAHFTARGEKVAYLNGNNLFTWDIQKGATEQITDFVEKIEEEPKRSSKDEWLYQDQLELFGVLRERKEKSDQEERIREKLEKTAPLPIEVGEKRVIHQEVGPNGRYITYVLMDTKKNKATIIPHFVTESGYTEDQTARTKVGDELPVYELYVYDLEKRTNVKVSLDALEGSERCSGVHQGLSR